MPVTVASLFSCLFLAIAGGLAYLLLRRHLPAFLPETIISLSGEKLACSLKPPGIAAPGTRPASASPFPPRATGQVVLLVDDDAGVRNMLSTVLLNHGYEVITARDGVEALAVFRRHQDRVALVITDINMPKGGGRSFAELLRPLRPDVPVLFMSGLESNGSGRDPGLARNKDPFLLKPFKPASLLHTVHGLLHGPAARS